MFELLHITLLIITACNSYIQSLFKLYKYVNIRTMFNIKHV